MRSRYSVFLSLALVAILAVALPHDASAQSAVAAADAPAAAPTDLAQAGPGGGDGLQEVIVTAQKRKENVKDIPISISAIGSDQIEESHLNDYDDLSRLVPGLAFNQTAGSEGENNIILRGVSSTSGSATVGIYLDDISVTVKNFFDGSTQPKLFDIDNIEVLRGPQGTLYGASSEGGTVRFITKQPDMENFSGEVGTDLSGTLHGGVNYGETAIVNIPIVKDKFAIRGSVGYFNDSGWIDNYNVNTGALNKSDVNDEGTMVVHLTAKVIPSDDLKITPSLFYQKAQTGDNSAYYSIAPDTTGENPVVPVSGFPTLGKFQQDKQIQEFARDTVFVPSVTVDKALDFADFTSVSGYFWRRESRQQNGTFYNSTAFADFFLDPAVAGLCPGGGTGCPATTTAVQNAIVANDQKISTIPSPIKYQTGYGQLSQEFRLASKPPEESGIPLKWVVGLYYADQWDHHTNYQQIPGIDNVFQSIYGVPMEQSFLTTPAAANFGFGPLPPGVTQYFPGDSDENDQSSYDERQLSAFGQADWDITPKLHGTIGMRYLAARVAYDFQTLGYYQLSTVSPYNLLDHFYALTPKYALTYDVTPNSNVYVSASKGFRLGGPNQPFPFGANTVCGGDESRLGITQDPLSFNSDKLWSYEVGTKNRLLDNHLSVDADFFYIDWENVQQQIYLPTCGYYATLNVGNAEILGGEAQIAYRPIGGLTVAMNMSYEHSDITSTKNPVTVPVGATLIDVPNWTYTLSADYNFAVGADTTAFTRADYDITGPSNGSYQSNNPNYSNPRYSVLNASVGFQTPHYIVELYGKNLLKNETVIQSPEINTIVEQYTVRPLTIGMKVRVPF